MVYKHSNWDTEKLDIHSDDYHKGGNDDTYHKKDSDAKYGSKDIYNSGGDPSDIYNSGAGKDDEKDKDKEDEEEGDTLADALKDEKKEEEQEEDLPKTQTPNQDLPYDDKKPVHKVKNKKSIEEAIDTAIKEEKDVVYLD